jgi:hypothetical protein
MKPNEKENERKLPSLRETNDGVKAIFLASQTAEPSSHLIRE